MNASFPDAVWKISTALGGTNNKVFASLYKLQLPDPEILARKIEAERRRLEQRQGLKKPIPLTQTLSPVGERAG
ncbi:MAG: hypothetical protein JW883_02210 [Deltaproteobacteria bacterium]|nr:hypothetical protein [Deltaproteobacteria bacterium]